MSQSSNKNNENRRSAMAALALFATLVAAAIITFVVFVTSMALALICLGKRRDAMGLVHVVLAWFASPIYLPLRILARLFPKSGLKVLKC